MKPVTPPTRRVLYALTASLQGIVLEAFVYPHGISKYAYAVLLDSVHVPGSPVGNFTTPEEAAHRAKGDFRDWFLEILNRV